MDYKWCIVCGAMKELCRQGPYTGQGSLSDPCDDEHKGQVDTFYYLGGGVSKV